MAELLLHVKVVPGASRSRVAGRYDQGVKVQVAAAPEKGKANGAVIDVLADWLDLKPGQLRIASGATQPRKIVAISGLSPDHLKTKLEQLS